MIEHTPDIPEEIFNAARILDTYFTERGIVKWEIGNVCSRNYADAVKVYEELIRFKEKHLTPDQ